MTAGNHAVALLPLIDAVLRTAGCEVHDLDAVAVSSGPGSFTGLRVGFGIAKGLARATGMQLIGISTLAALARSVTGHDGVICALLDARRGELYAACFAAARGRFERLTADALVTPEALLATMPTACVVVGDGGEKVGTMLRAHFGDGVTVLSSDAYAPRGAVVAAMAAERLRAGQSDDLPSAEPLYVRASDAELKFT